VPQSTSDAETQSRKLPPQTISPFPSSPGVDHELVKSLNEKLRGVQQAS
jgi:hypothetical protein